MNPERRLTLLAGELMRHPDAYWTLIDRLIAVWLLAGLRAL